jgi:hypothetical protein
MVYLLKMVIFMAMLNNEIVVTPEMGGTVHGNVAGRGLDTSPYETL